MSQMDGRAYSSQAPTCRPSRSSAITSAIDTGPNPGTGLAAEELLPAAALALAAAAAAADVPAALATGSSVEKAAREPRAPGVVPTLDEGEALLRAADGDQRRDHHADGDQRGQGVQDR